MKRSNVRISTMLAVAGAVMVAAATGAFAQSTTGLRIGLLGGANYNYVNAATQDFVQVTGNPDFSSHDFSGASALNGYGGIMGEYLFNDFIGASLRATFDARCVEKEDNGSTFTPHIWYVSLEPGVRLNLGMPELHAMVGGTVGIKVRGEYDYSPATSEGAQEITGEKLENVNDVALGAWAGFGYDFRITGEGSNVGLYVTPFAEGSYLFDQKEPDVTLQEDAKWNTLTVRAGVQLKAQF